MIIYVSTAGEVNPDSWARKLWLAEVDKAKAILALEDTYRNKEDAHPIRYFGEIPL